MSFLTISHLEKSFGATRVVKDFNLSVEKGEFISLLGPSGCGKTTVLRMIAGFETPSSGSIAVDGKDVLHLKTSRRSVGMMFQAYALFPNLTVADNVGFGLKVAGVARAQREARVAEMLALIGLPDLGARFPFQLSGGQQQRVALARALAPKPRVLLLDEPLSALDAKVRVSLRNEIRAIQRDLGITTIFVTHDQEEALSISDRIVVMTAGVADQVGTPFEIYNRPTTRFVANFVGQLNLFTADDQGRVGGVQVGQGEFAARPEAVHLGREPGADIILPATVEEVHFLGSVIRLTASAAGTRIALDIFNRPDAPPPAIGSALELSLSSSDLIALK